MKRYLTKKSAVVCAAVLALAAVATPQGIGGVIKVLGIGAAVHQFGPQINTALNKLSNHKDSNTVVTKVVPILSGGINGRKAVGAAQVMGPRSKSPKSTPSRRSTRTSSAAKSRSER